MGLDTTPRTWTTSELVTAAMLNTEVRDALTGIQAAWTAYTPTWTSNGTAPALGNGTLTGAYLQIGNTVLWRLKFTAGSTTTFGTGAYFFSLPLTPAQNPVPVGWANVQDASPAAAYVALAMYVGDGGGFRMNSTTSPAVVVSATSPVTFASADVISAGGSFETP